MSFERLPESVHTLYAELLDQAIFAATTEGDRPVPSGSFISKTLKGNVYFYLQRSEGERKRQIYLGPDSEELRSWMDRVTTARLEARADIEHRTRLCSMLATGGATTEEAAVIKILQILAEARVFRLGGVIVGTQAFRTYANMLGVRFEGGALRTQDVDVAHDPAIGVALCRDQGRADVERSLSGSEIDFDPIPALGRDRPSTSFRIRGRELRVDFLTPMYGRETSEPVYLPAYGLCATPLRLLDYLLEGTTQAVAVGTRDVLVNVPTPARFALHKLWTSQKRSSAFQAKAAKDLRQAAQVVEVLVEDRPADLALAWEALVDRSRARKRILAAIAKLAEPPRQRLLSVIGESTG